MPPTSSIDPQRQANDRLWARRSLVKQYANRVLRPVEALLFDRYRPELAGRVLELGCGAGRLTGYLADIAATVHGIDISAQMVAYCRRTYPKATFSQGDLRDVARMGSGSFDAVVAGDNVLDVLDDPDRGRVLDDIHQVLAAGGLLIMSSHNLAYAPHLAEPTPIRSHGFLRVGLALVRWPIGQFNRRRLRQFERSEPGYSILNDVSHDYMALHYYVSQEAQQSQLAEHGFEYVECLAADGRRVDPGDDVSGEPWLHYVARRGAERDAQTLPPR
jgi:SAM-dependent methyltransferase